MQTVLMTGATGQVAQGVLPFLANAFAMRLFAPDISNDLPMAFRGDILDWQSLQDAMSGVDAVLHLAIAGGHTGIYENDAFNDQRFDVNVKGTYHVMEAARRSNVRRVVHVSSLMVSWGEAQRLRAAKSSQRVPGAAAARPAGTYALTKYLSEEIAAYYAEEHGMEILTLRIGAPLAIDESPAGTQTARPQQVPFPDLAQAFRKVLTVPLNGYEVVSICGNSRACPWSLDAARRVLGYEPAYCLDDMDLVLLDPFAVEER